MSMVAGVLASVAGKAIFKKLGPIVLKAGAPILAEVVKSNVGPAAGKVVDAIASNLGVEPTPEAIVAAHQQAPAHVEQVIREVETSNPEFWRSLASLATEVNATMRAEASSTSIMQRIWRPIFGLVYALCFVLLIVAIVWPIFRGDVATINALIGISGLVISLMTMGAGVVGVYVWKRSDEKIKGAA